MVEEDTEAALARFRRQWQAEMVHKDSTTAKLTIETVKSDEKSYLVSKDTRERPLLGLHDVEAGTPALSKSIIQSMPGSEATALEHYIFAVERERQGMLSDALTHYRAAFRKDSQADSSYRKHLLSLPAEDTTVPHASLEDSNYAKVMQTTPDYELRKEDDLTQITTLVGGLSLSIEPADLALPHKICSLPEELLLHIITTVLTRDYRSYTAVSLTCRKFYLLAQEEDIWRTISQEHFRHQHYIEDAPMLSAPSAQDHWETSLKSECITVYNSSWQRMFLQKPRVQYDGIYIATCHYTRPGVREQSLSWTSPIHLVTYFRYLRFYSDRRCLSLLTTSEPRDVVHDMRMRTKLPGVQLGTFQVSKTGRIDVEIGGPANYLFSISLQIKSSSRGRQNKLTWIDFQGTHPQSLEVTTFNLKNDKAFFYSRVLSYAS